MMMMMTIVTADDCKTKMQAFASSLVCKLFMLAVRQKIALVVQEFDATTVLNLIEMLLSIAHDDRQKCLASSSDQHQQAASCQLEHLICSLQSRLLAWCQQHLTDDEDEDDHHRDAEDESRLIVQAVIVRCMYDQLALVIVISIMMTRMMMWRNGTKQYSF